MTVSKGPDQGGPTVDSESSVNAAEQEWVERWQRGPQRRTELFRMFGIQVDWARLTALSVVTRRPTRSDDDR
jgi:hypothetical protein